MSLGTRLTLKTAVLVLAVLVVAGVALWGLGGLNRDLDDALGEYDRLRVAYEVSFDVENARSVARNQPQVPAQLRQPLQRVVLRLQERSEKLDPDRAQSLRLTLSAAVNMLDEPIPTSKRVENVSDLLNFALNTLLAEIEDATSNIRTIELNAQKQRARIILWVGVTAALAALAAIVVGFWQYAAVMRPLRRLQRGVERLASGDFAERLRSAGDREFVQLADDFNKMADDLAALYHQLEDKVRLRSAQLAQSERLASVGFLAAGVAHEINNPLAIIAGEAELALHAMPKDPSDKAEAASRQALTVIRDEAFRCKTITQKLLSLARPGTGTREPVDLGALAEEVAALVRTLPQHEGRSIRVECPAPTTAMTDPASVKQVLLNLFINALEAVDPGGSVRIAVSSRGDRASLAVHDTGKGMTDDVLARVFEPFYTEKKSPTTPGLGLGLSISHAIVEDLGGRLTAASPGPGKGSTFTIELPISR